MDLTPKNSDDEVQELSGTLQSLPSPSKLPEAKRGRIARQKEDLVAFLYFALLLAIFPSGDSALLDVSLEHDNVQRGQPIEINVQQMLLDAKEEAFVRTECGFSLGPRILIPFVKMAKPTRTFSVVKSSQYKNRIKIFGNFTIIVKNATFQDEGTTFYCQLSFVYMKDTQHFTDDIVKYVKLKNVYVNCDDPGIPTYGYRKDNKTTYGSKIEFACNKGYKLIGLDTIICQKYGNWTGQIPKCQSIYNCDDPGIPTYGYRKDNKTTYGSKIEFACNKGYKLIGLDTIICQKYGNWTGQIPKCQSIFPQPRTSSVKKLILLYIIVPVCLFGFLIGVGCWKRKQIRSCLP